MDLISLIVGLILIGLAFWVVRTLSAAFAIPAPIVTVLNVILVVFCVLWLLRVLGLYTTGPLLR